MAVDGERVEEDVDVGVGGEVVGEGEFSGEGDAGFVDVLRGESVEDAGLADGIFEALGDEVEGAVGSCVRMAAQAESRAGVIL